MSSPAVLGIDVGGTKISLSAVDSIGHLLAYRRIETRSKDGAAVVLQRLTAAARAMVGDLDARGIRVRGAGVVTPGVVEPRSVKLAPNNEGWDEVALAAVVSDGLGVPVSADNDAKAATAAEATWGALKGVTDGILLNLGTGISAGAIVGGQLLRGAHGAALEIAYQVPSVGPLHGFGDGRAPLEEIFSGSGLASAASALSGRPTRTDDVFAAMDVVGRIDPSDHPSREVLQLAALGSEALNVAVRAVVNLAIALDPQVIAVSGGMLRSAHLIVEPMARALADLVPFPPDLVTAHFAERAPLAGACLIGYRTAGIATPAELEVSEARPSEQPRRSTA